MDFSRLFERLTENAPFPWQVALYERFISNKLDSIPPACNLPTGLGKTSVIAVWLIALANHPDRVPRRLVYVVNRRTVVDQTTVEVEKYRIALRSDPALGTVRDQLAKLCALPLAVEGGNTVSPIALSTLRGQFADNREWSADPARPAVIVGTVDMIGSRLLFGGYGVGFKGKPLHAGFLGQDVLLVHDEAHLEPAFQKLLIGIEQEQQRCSEFRKIRVMELSATSRGEGEVFSLTAKDAQNSEVKKRIGAKKTISLHEFDDEKKLAELIARLAQGLQMENRAVLLFVRKVDDVGKIIKLLPDDRAQQLTGTLRGLERDRMADPRKEKGCPIFARFLKQPKPGTAEAGEWKIKPQSGTVYLVCTSAGEVGVNISADHLICDLSTFESMAQRFGRVNRFGDCKDTEIHIVHPKKFDESDIETRRANTLGLVRKLEGDGSPKALNDLPSKERLDAFVPEPQFLATSDFLFDAWSLSTIKGQLPGRPPVEPYLHGIEDDQVLETQFAWREEVALLTGLVGSEDIDELMDQARLKPHELLRVTTYGKGRAYDQLQKIADRSGELPVWIIEPDGSLIIDRTISDLVLKRGADYINPLGGRTVILPPKAGGLTSRGALDGDEAYTTANRDYDVAGLASKTPLLRFKVSVDADGISQLDLVAPIDDVPEV
ncbi:MAG TPA: type I-U CRISPR-associated helicase/endonuclease Cas3, partial [Schlesneria sp.]